MDKSFEAYRRAILGLRVIIFRHFFVLVNAVIFGVVALLFVFGDFRSGIFLGAILIYNTIFGIGQDFRARVELEKLQLLTALRVTRVNKNGTEEIVLAEKVGKDEHIKLKLGDQVPCDSVVLISKGFEVSEALITGESDSFPKHENDKVLAGDIVTAGTATVLTETTFSESRMAKMAEDIRKYSVNPSPIQIAINTIIKNTGYILIVVVLFVIARGVLIHQPGILVVKNIGALASIIVPQGLVVAATLFFAFGAASYSRRKVLFQEINATEKFGRIKNLCMDKTGTLTDNNLIVEQLHVPPHVSHTEAEELILAYMKGSGDSSQTINAIKEYTKREYQGVLGEGLPFSSWRRYGVVQLGERGSNGTVFVGSADIFLPHIAHKTEHEWLTHTINEYSHKGKRLLCIARAKESLLSRDLSHTKLSVVGVLAFQGNLRDGIQSAVKFFQDRGVRIRIISGDNADTARSIAAATGILNTDATITGTEIKAWTMNDYNEKAKNYTVFARIVPEQKVKIIEALKRDGFTAMVGDGANDALAIKKADLGIAMFDGAPATRQLASVVLMNNSFTALPGAVKLADNFIMNIEIFASIFLNQTMVGLFFFVMLTLLGYTLPITPLNVTLTNLFTVGLPSLAISYWAIRPEGNIPPASIEPFLKRVLPFPATGAVIQAIAIAIVFMVSPTYLKAAQSNTLVLFAFIIFGFIFFALSSSVYGSSMTRAKKTLLTWFGVGEVVLLYTVFQIPMLVTFFDITPVYPRTLDILWTTIISLVFGYGLYELKRQFFLTKRADISLASSA